MNPVYLSTSTCASCCWAFPSLLVFLSHNLPGEGVKLFCIWCVTWDSWLRLTTRKALVIKFWCQGDVCMIFTGRKHKLMLFFVSFFMIWKLFVHSGFGFVEPECTIRSWKGLTAWQKVKRKALLKNNLFWNLISSCVISYSWISLLHVGQ